MSRRQQSTVPLPPPADRYPLSSPTALQWAEALAALGVPNRFLLRCYPTRGDLPRSSSPVGRTRVDAVGGCEADVRARGVSLAACVCSCLGFLPYSRMGTVSQGRGTAGASPVDAHAEKVA